MKILKYLSAYMGGMALLLSLSLGAFGSCSAPANQIEAENCLLGTPSTQWDVNGAGDPSIQGFATDISVNVGQAINFKINTDANAYSIQIYRIGYYAGKGARLITTIQPSATLPQVQPACLTDTSTGLVDCGNWAISASWQVPANATSGIYFAHLVRSDTGGDSHIVFVVRNDASSSAILFQTADESWQAYNGYDGSSLYGPSDQFDLTQRGYKVSYNRPFITRGFAAESATWVFGAEYPMVRWLESNGYDVSYFTGVDAARFGTLIQNHKLYLSVGHDEYWSGPHRNNVEAARNAGVNLAFFSGNEVFWKTRWENSVDGTNTPYRTLVCYKETLGPSSSPPAAAAVDPLDPPIWTGTWRDGTHPFADGGRPENSLTGTLFQVNGPSADNPGNLSIQVPDTDGKMRFWRNTTVATLAPGTIATLPKGTLGYEWDEDVDNGARPAGNFDLSTSSRHVLASDLLLDQGGTYGAGTAVHHLTLHRQYNNVGQANQTPLGLVFGAGTVQWSWGLDNNHDNPFGFSNPAPSVAMQQATVNLFADMGVQPTTLKAGLVSATASTDTAPPASSITWPTSGSVLTSGGTVMISGTASDTGGGVIGGVEVSIDGGATWHPASGRESWNYSWTPTTLGSFNLEARATDDSGNLEIPSAANSVVTINPPDCPCSDWSASTVPSQVDSKDATAGEYGVRFRADFDGYITGIRFYKATTNTGTHVGNLWSNSGSLLATGAFSSETASGWQQVTFSEPVAITANTTYVASYFTPTGHYSDTAGYFTNSGSDAPPLHLLKNGVDGLNGVFSYSSGSTFPTLSFNSTNYWVDVTYVPASSMPGAPPALLVQPGKLTFAAFQGNGDPPSQSVTVYNEGSGTLNWTASSSAPWLIASPNSGSTPASVAVSVNAAGLTAGTYTGTVTITSAGATNPPQTINVSLSVTNLLLFSNFSDGTMNGWAFSPLGFASNWSVANGALQYNGGGHTQAFAGNSIWADYTLNVAVKLASLNDYPGGIRGRLNPATGAGYAVWLYPHEGLIKLFRNTAWNIDTGLVLVAQGSASFDSTNFHNVQLSFKGSQIGVLYDGRQVITATDATYSSGLIALDVSNQVISFTNVMVTSNTANTGSLTSSPASLSFSAQFGAANPSPQTVQLNNAGSGSLVWTATSSATWLSISPAFGNTASSLQASAASSALNPGTYNATITVFALASLNTATTIPVTLTVVAQPPSLAVSASAISFSGFSGQPIAPQAIAISNGSGAGSFTWTAASDSSWLTIAPATGSVPQNVTVNANPAGLPNGTHIGHITVTASGVSNSPQIITVSLQILAQDMAENFSDLGSGWIISPMGLGTGWKVANGTYSYSGLGLSQSCAGNSAWSDYTFDTNVQLANLSNWPGGVRARVNPSTGAGYAVWLYPGYGKAILYRVSQWDINGPGLIQLAVAPLTFDLSKHDLKLTFAGNLISVYWDGISLMSASDATYANGFVCFDTDNQPISYSNVSVASVQNPVTLDSVTPSSLVFNAGPGFTPAPQTVNITAGGANTTWAATSNVSWMAAAPSNSLTPGSLTISVNPSGMTPGSYPGSVTVSAPGASNSPLIIPVTLAINSTVLSVTPSTLTFFGAVGLNPNPQSIQISNTGTASLNWTASHTSSWLGLSSTSGTTPASVTVTAGTTTTGAGTFNDMIKIASNGVANSPLTVPVSMQVGSLLFSDTFSAGAGNWTISPLGFSAGWTIVNGTYTYNGGGHTQSYAGSSAWTDYTVAADFQLASLSDYPGGLRGRVNTTTGSSYGVWIYPNEKVLKLFRIGQWNIDSDLSLLGQSAPINIDTNQHNLRLVFQGTTIQVYYDNVLEITAADASYSQGAVALDVSNQPIAFDNVTVISLP